MLCEAGRGMITDGSGCCANAPVPANNKTAVMSFFIKNK
jgi:hypothetical protein